jgi:hypothetical protein
MEIETGQQQGHAQQTEKLNVFKEPLDLGSLVFGSFNFDFLGACLVQGAK